LSIGLILTGGGARGAFQAGAIKALLEIYRSQGWDKKGFFPIISGISAGAINGAVLASEAQDLSFGVDKLCEFWSTLKSSDIYRTDIPSMMGTALRWMADLSSGGIYNRQLAGSLLNSLPLREFLNEKINFEQIHENIKNKHLKSFSCSAFSYAENKSICFFDSIQDVGWIRDRRRGEKRKIQVEHILASSAIPLVFRPIKIGNGYFGDGALRNMAPISPVIHMGAKKIIIIGVRPENIQSHPGAQLYPSPSRIFGYMLNSLFFDSVDGDVERILHINDILQRDASPHENVKKIEILWIRPSMDIGLLAEKLSSNLPTGIKYLLSGIGNKSEYAELASHIMFESEYTQKLISLGFEDTKAISEKIKQFILK
jgi:NTE family protein